MKKKNKRSITKRKKEFRFHNVKVKKQNGKEANIRHPAFVFLEKGNIYIYATITHSNNVRGVLTIKLHKNPNPED